VAQAIFVESDAQAAWVSQHACAQPREAVVALTAEAVEALETLGVPHVPVGDVSDLRPLASVVYELSVEVTRITRHIEAYISAFYPPARTDGPGFVEGQGYVLQHDVSTVAARAVLIIDAIRILRLSSIALFAGPIDHAFREDGYVEPPVAAVIRKMFPEVKLDLREVVPSFPSSNEGRTLLGRIRNRAALIVEQLTAHRRTVGHSRQHRRLNGLRVLLADGATYDWGPVAAELLRQTDVRLTALNNRTFLDDFWSHAYEPVLYTLSENRSEQLGVGSYTREPDEEALLSELFNRWVQDRAAEARLYFLGVDLLPGLIPHFRHIVRRGLTFLRHADAVATAALDRAQPDAVCFFAIPTLASKRVAFAARRRGVPVVAYQHGATYGTHLQAMHAQIDQAHADYFLTYGVGTAPLEHPGFPVRAEFVNVGSARIDAMRRLRPPPRRNRPRVLWVGEFATANLYGTPYSLEDTRRYAIEKEGLSRLTSSGLIEVMYRPHRHQWKESGIARWLGRRGLPVDVDVVQPLERLIRASDLVVTDGSSGQVWYEALAIGVPVIAFCDPVQTRLTEEFERDLATACMWYRDEESFLRALGRLAADPAAVMHDLEQIDVAPFLEKYILGAGSHRPVDRVLAFLGALRAQSGADPCRAGR
jgi:hypothetical protein